MKKSIYAFFCVLAFFSMNCSVASAGFYNGGTFQSNKLNLQISGTLENNGKLIGMESATITCDTFAGNNSGLLKSPLITLRAQVFNYRGTIDCSNECILYVKEPFDTSMFKKTGGGRFEIIITSEDPKAPLETDMSNEVSVDCCLIQ